MQISITMKKHFLILTTLILASRIGFSQTTVTGGLVSGTWSVSGSPYLIQGSIMIPKDSILSIQAGVTVSFQGMYKLLVLGKLLAEGTIVDTITFTATNTANGWRGIRFDNTASTNDTSKLTYCKLQYGKATGTSPDNNGGGLYFANFSKAVISNCRITNCSSNNNGGGIYCAGGNPVILRNTISHNIGGYDGGGIFCDYFADPIISNNTISNNSTPSYGGGICCFYTSPIITNNLITNNNAGNGGGINSDTGNPIISNNTISGNTAAAQGGGIYCSTGSPSILGNIISSNSASVGGGIMFDTGYSMYVKTLSNNIISNNTATLGGGLYLRDENAITVISNNIIINNSATAGNNGGGIYCSGSSSEITNCTIANNNATNGGALYCINASKPNFRNCILWGNVASSSGSQVFLFDEPSDPNFFYCDIEGGMNAFATNGNFYTGLDSNNLDSNPIFVAPSSGSGIVFNGVSADWSLMNTSTCIDSGSPTGTYPSTDFAGNPRIMGSFIDIGAFEFQGSVVIVKQELQNQFTLFPNPFNSSAKIQFNSSINNIALSIYDLFGQEIKTINSISEPTFTLYRDNLPNGIYLLKISQENRKSTTRKFVITDN
jgi:predicted outer membrane repeat protein